MFTILPGALRASSRRPTSRAIRNALDRLTAMTRSQSSSECSAAGARRIVPALFSRMSIGPSAASASRDDGRRRLRIAEVAASPWPTGGRARRSPPPCPSGGTLRSCTTTSAPASASASAMARPRPAVAPVTSAIFPSSRTSSVCMS